MDPSVIPYLRKYNGANLTLIDPLLSYVDEAVRMDRRQERGTYFDILAHKGAEHPCFVGIRVSPPDYDSTQMFENLVECSKYISRLKGYTIFIDDLLKPDLLQMLSQNIGSGQIEIYTALKKNGDFRFSKPFTRDKVEQFVIDMKETVLEQKNLERNIENGIRAIRKFNPHNVGKLLGDLISPILNQYK